MDDVGFFFLISSKEIEKTHSEQQQKYAQFTLTYHVTELCSCFALIILTDSRKHPFYPRVHRLRKMSRAQERHSREMGH